jgi:hypothetical protein
MTLWKGFMAEVIDLGSRRVRGGEGAEELRLSGRAICGACFHEWEGDAAVGAVHLDCPACGRAWGLFKNPVEPETCWRCRCGEELFWLTPAGAMCRGCGHLVERLP